MTFAIRRNTYYYAGTYNAEPSKIVSVHRTKSEACAALARCEATYSDAYWLDHGEYARPDFRIIGINKATFKAHDGVENSSVNHEKLNEGSH